MWAVGPSTFSYAPYAGGSPLGEHGDKKKNGITPRMVAKASAVEDSGTAGSKPGGATHLVGLNTYAPTPGHYSESTSRGHVGKTRQRKVKPAYLL